MSNIDPFDDVLNLEDQYYTEGYNLGVADGARAGRHEGRTFGLEKGFEKAVEMGRLSGRAAVWDGRLKNAQDALKLINEAGSSQKASDSSTKIKPLRRSDRLEKHVARLIDLTDPESAPTKNSEEDVEEFEDRLRDAKAKATLISKMVGEHGNDVQCTDGAGATTGSINDQQTLRIKKAVDKSATGEMEDFAGLRKR